MNIATPPHECQTAAAGRPVVFSAQEVLVSATDGRGVIKYANGPFCDVSGFTRDELIKAPHKIVRHKDTPKGMFHLIWSKLKQGKAVGAYVKNRTKTNHYYWVFGIITPLDHGFLSVRIKPQTAFFDMARALYTDVLAREQDGLSPDRSSDLIRKALLKQGFATYSSFMEQALAAEFDARAKETESDTEAFLGIDALSEMVAEMRNCVDKVGYGFKQVRGEPVNLRILAGRLEGTGAALATISQNYDMMAQDMYDLISLLNASRNGALSEIESAIAHGKSALHTASLMKDAAEAVVERETADVEGKDLLEAHCARLQKVGRIALGEIATASLPIPDICRRVRRRINGLDVVKLLCKVESGRLHNSDDGLEGIIDRLERFHDQTDRDLATLMTQAVQIRQKSTAL